MARSRWIERGLVALALVGAAGSWRAASDVGREVNTLAARVDALADAQDKLNQAAIRARTLPSADMFQPGSASRPTPTAGGRGGLGFGGRGGARAAGAGGQTPAGAADDATSGVALTPALRREARRASQSPGAVMLDSLYEAADQLAVEQEWAPATYDGVTRVFDDTMMRMNGLYEKARAGDMTMRDARKDAFQLRNKAVDDLTDLIGQEGVLELRDAFAGEIEALREGE